MVGRIDFRIRDMKWVIECVRDGDKIDDKWIKSGEIKDYIILDFRTSEPRKARSRLYCSSRFDEC